MVIEATPSLTFPEWAPIATIELKGSVTKFEDPEWSRFSNRFYRLRGL